MDGACLQIRSHERDRYFACLNQVLLNMAASLLEPSREQHAPTKPSRDALDTTQESCASDV